MSNEADFFVAGGTLRTSAPSYVTRPADAELLQQLQAGEFCYVLTPRQMGKSSLMVRTAQRLRAEGGRVVIIDLTSIGASSSAISADQWYLGLLSRMRSDLRLATDVQAWWQAHSAFSVSQRFTDFLQQVVLTECADKVAILIDEIDSTLNLPFRDDFFAAIRALYNERAHNPIYSRLTFALFGVATPTDLIQDRERTPFNIGRRIDLREFTPVDAEPLRQGLTHRLPEQATAIFQRIFYWTNGHPYLTQKLCHAVVLQPGEWQAEQIEQTVDQLVHTAFLSEEGRKDPNLTFVQDRILTSPEQERRQMLRLYRRVRSGERVADDDRSPTQNRLELYGLVGVAQGMLRVRNRIYEKVFTPAWVDSMMPTNRRQRSALLAATIALLIVAGISAFLFLQSDPTCSELQAQFEENATNSSIRISTLAGLIQREDTCGSIALYLFYNLEPQEQIALFVGLSNPLNERTRLETVIDGIYRTLDTTPEHDLKLMNIWLNTLKNAEVVDSDALISSIRNWKTGRELINSGEYSKAISVLSEAIVPDHPVIYYDRAMVYIKLRAYSKALEDLENIVRIAKIYMPTPIPSGMSPLSPLATTRVEVTLSPHFTQTATSVIQPLESFSTVQTAVLERPIIDGRIAVSQALDFILTPSRSISNSMNSDSIYTEDSTNFLLRFSDTISILNTVRETVQNNPELLDYWGTNSTQYALLDNLGIKKRLYLAKPISNHPASQEFPAVDGDRIVWQDARFGATEIFLMNLAGGEPINITQSSTWEVQPAIVGDKIVWKDGYTGIGIHGINLSTNTIFTVTSGQRDVSRPRLSGNIVVWADNRAGNDNWNIYAYDINNATELVITDAPGNQMDPQIDSPWIVWWDYQERIYLYNLETNQQQTILTTHGARLPDVSVADHLVIWQDMRNGNWDLYGFDLSLQQEIPFIVAPRDQENAIIDQGVIAFQSKTEGGTFNINLLDLASKQTFPIEQYSSPQLQPALSNGLVVWQDTRNHQADIFYLVWAGDIPQISDFVVAAPSNLQIGALPIGTMLLQWQDNADSEDGFVIERAEGITGTQWIEIAHLPANTTSYIDRPPQISESYWYRIRANSSRNYSQYSNESFNTTFAGTPNPDEFYLMTLINAARLAPDDFGYKDYEPLPPLVFNPLLAYAAHSHSQSILNSSFQFGHCDPIGRCPSERVRAVGYAGNCAENLIAIYSTGPAAMEEANQSFLASEGHRNNMLATDLTEFGVGHTFDIRKGSNGPHGQITEIFCGQSGISIPALPTGAVVPYTGTTATEFLYIVNFYSSDGYTPTKSYVFINDRPYAMDLVVGEASHGTYHYKTTLTEQQLHTYRFQFEYGPDLIARWPETGTINGPSINNLK